MKESSTYQAILEEGRMEGRTQGRREEALRVLRLQGDAAFGEPDGLTAAAIERIADLKHLEAMLKRVRTAHGWQDLLGAETAPLIVQESSMPTPKPLARAESALRPHALTRSVHGAGGPHE